MSLPLLIQGLGSIGLFSSRAFLPAFATALLLRCGPQVTWLAHAGLLQHIRGVPTWFTSDTSLIILGLLSALELAAERLPEARTLLDELHDYLKLAMAALTFLGVLGASDRALVRGFVGEAGPVEYLPALAVGAGTFLASKARGVVMGPLGEADEDDDLGLQAVLRWVEDLWGALGPLALILLPLLTLALVGIALVLLLLAGRYVESREEAKKVPCTNCQQPIYASAIACPHCNAPNKEPRAVELLGGTKEELADPDPRTGRDPCRHLLPPGDRRPVPTLHPAGAEHPAEVGHPAGEPRPGGAAVGAAPGWVAPSGDGADRLRGLSERLREAGNRDGMRGGMSCPGTSFPRRC